MPPSLLQFLKQARQTHLHFLTGTLPRAETSASSPIYVIGNSAVDLDSIISAIVYAYFAHNRLPHDHPRPHVPLINLAHVPSGPELRRLRPEFVKALWHSTAHPPLADDEKWDDTPESAGKFLPEHVITVEDFAVLIRQFGQDGTPQEKQEQQEEQEEKEEKEEQQQQQQQQPRLNATATLVDWNALPIRSSDGQPGKGSLADLPTVDFSVVACVDHHVDEGFLPDAESIPPRQPFVVRPAGSCTSLVVNTLASLGLWGHNNNNKNNGSDGTDLVTGASGSVEESQVAQLALASILIDTANLTDKSKVTDSDTTAVSFLLSKIHPSTLSPSSSPSSSNPLLTLNQTTPYYEDVFTTKQNCLDLLTTDEILDRDFKTWTETLPHQSDCKITLGFCSAVKPIPWLVRKADNDPHAWLDALYAFSARHGLDVVVVMTAFTDEAGRFSRELFVSDCRRRPGGTGTLRQDSNYSKDTDDSINKHKNTITALESFVATATSKLGLEDWTPPSQTAKNADTDGDAYGIEPETDLIKSALNSNSPNWKRVWVQRDVTQSRKQVAPLLRGKFQI